MPEFASGSSGEGLVLQALLYVTGELSRPDAAVFEERLAGDADAQMALCHAVQLTQQGTADGSARPHPAYRRRVQRRLRRPQGRRGLTTGRAVAWGASAVCVVLVVGLCWPLQTPPSQQPSSLGEAPPESAQDVELTIARKWADLTVLGDSHLAKALHPDPLQQEAPSEELSAEEEDFWAAVNDTSHLAQARKEVLNRNADRPRKGDPATHATDAILQKDM